jgi:hypothetical protein
MADGKDIQAVELVTIAVSKEDKEGRSWRLRLVQWVVDGEAKSIKLERRNFFKDAYGEIKTGKADGFTLKDLEACKEHWPKIMDLMKNPPAVKPKDIKEAAKEILGAEEVPF